MILAKTCYKLYNKNLLAVIKYLKDIIIEIFKNCILIIIILQIQDYMASKLQVEDNKIQKIKIK